MFKASLQTYRLGIDWVRAEVISIVLDLSVLFVLTGWNSKRGKRL